MNKKIRIYFICIHNQCRSQMAEGFAKHFGGDNVEVHSGGLEQGELDPMTIHVMREAGVNISEQTSKGIDMKIFVQSNIIVKLCEEVKEKCPIVPFGIQNEQWNIPDPIGGDLESYRTIRDQLKQKVFEFLNNKNLLSKEVTTYG